MEEPRLRVSTTREYHLPQASCASCGGGGLDITEMEYDVENSGPVLMSVGSCRSCGCKHVDVFSLSTHEPTATTLKVRSSEDMKVRIIRGSTAAVLVPELGVSIEPGFDTEGFITNVEGVLVRIENVLRFLSHSLQGSRKRKAESVLKKIQRAKDDKPKFTLVLKDPFGNSTIVSQRAKRRRIGKRELIRLKFGGQAIAMKR